MTDDKKVRDVLIVSGGGVTQSLWAGLSEKFDLCILYPQAAQLAEEMRLAGSFALMSMIDPSRQEVAENAAVLLSARIVGGMGEIEKSFECLGNDRPAELNGNMGKWWVGFTHHNLRRATLMLVALRQLADTRNVVGCVVHEDVTLEMRVAVDFCKANGIKTFHLPHAACHLVGESLDIHRETRTDYLLASGEYMKDWYARTGFNPNNIFVVGAPQWDGLYDGGIPTREEARRVLRIETDYSICYATTWGQTTSLRGGDVEKEFDEGLAAVIDVVRSLKAALLIKVHPNETQANEAFYEQALREAKVPGLVTRHHTTYVLRACDVLAAQSPSNLCIEAAILGVPSCYLQTAGFDFVNEWGLPYRGEGLLEMVNKAGIEFVGSGKWDAFVKYYNEAHGEEWDATERCVETVIEKLNHELHKLHEEIRC